VFEGIPWGVVVLTFPEAVRWPLRRRATYNQVRREAVAVVVAWARRWMFSSDVAAAVRLGGISVMHPEGDERPGFWAPHINIIFGIAGELDATGDVIRGRYHVPPAALDDLRDRWARVLASLGWEPKCDPQVFYEFRTEPNHKRHAVRYFCRSFPMWKGWTQRVGYWGLLRTTWRPEGYEPTPYRPSEARNRCDLCGGPMKKDLQVSKGLWSWFERDGTAHLGAGKPPHKYALWIGGHDDDRETEGPSGCESQASV